MDKICIIDDDEDSNTILAAFLGDKWDVVTYQEWEKALQMIESDHPELILLDISLPGISGVEVLKRIREKSSLKHVKVIALTGYSLPGDRGKFLDLGFDEYLAKPVLNENMIINLVEKCLR